MFNKKKHHEWDHMRPDLNLNLFSTLYDFIWHTFTEGRDFNWGPSGANLIEDSGDLDGLPGLPTSATAPGMKPQVGIPGSWTLVTWNILKP